MKKALAVCLAILDVPHKLSFVGLQGTHHRRRFLHYAPQRRLFAVYVQIRIINRMVMPALEVIIAKDPPGTLYQSEIQARALRVEIDVDKKLNIKNKAETRLVNPGVTYLQSSIAKNSSFSLWSSFMKASKEANISVRSSSVCSSATAVSCVFQD